MGLARTAAFFALVVAMARPGSAQPSAKPSKDPLAKPLRATARAGTADGRSVIAIAVSGGPPPRAGELEKAPELPAVRCTGAQALASMGSGQAAVLAPARATGRRIPCTVTWRDARASLSLAVSRPGAGLYAEVPPRVISRSGPVSLKPFVIDASGQAHAPTALRAKASSGTVRVTDAGVLELDIGDSKAPRAIAIAMADGQTFGVAYVVVTGASVLPVRAQRRASVRVRAAGSWSKSVRARRGRARVPVEVLPGVEQAIVRATLRGYSVESPVRLPPVTAKRVAALAATESVEAGAEADIIVAYAGSNGRPEAGAGSIAAAAGRGSVSAAESVGPGMWRIRYRAPADQGADTVVVRVAGDDAAGESSVQLEVRERRRPPPVVTPSPAPKMLVGAWAGIAMASNANGLKGPRIAAGAGLERVVGPVQVALLLGVDWFIASDAVSSNLGGVDRDVDRKVESFGFPVRLRARLAVAKRWGLWGGASMVPTLAQVELMPEFQSVDRYTDFALGLRASVGLDLEVWRARVSLGASVGHSEFAGEQAAGTIERIAVLLGYELWFLDTGL